MRQALLVGIGGFLGSVLRYGTGALLLGRFAAWKFPVPTVFINVSGCLAAGIIAGAMEKHNYVNADARLFLFVGLLGGFTTFSAFGLETVQLIQRGEFRTAFLNVAVSVVLGIFALWVGAKLTLR